MWSKITKVFHLINRFCLFYEIGELLWLILFPYTNSNLIYKALKWQRKARRLRWVFTTGMFSRTEPSSCTCTGLKIILWVVFSIPLATELGDDPVSGWVEVTDLIVASVTWLSRRVPMVMYDVLATNTVDLLIVESSDGRVGLVIVTLCGNIVWEIPTIDL